MKKIIYGVTYDVDLGILIGKAVSTRDGLEYWSAMLLKTPRSGRYFIVGEGGPLTRFAQGAGRNRWEGGADLIPLTRDQAMVFAETYLTAAVVEEEFGKLTKIEGCF